VTALAEMVETLDLDERVVNWGDLLGKPTAYPPTAHLHDIGDVYGFEYVVEALESIRHAILMGDQATFDELRGIISIINQLLNDHKDDLNNPHQVTKAQVGLGNVDNYPTAELVDAQAGVSDTTFMTPFKTVELMNSIFTPIFEAHTENINNPHQVTKAQIGLGNVENFRVATRSEAVAGQSVNTYMTPLTTKQFLDESIITVLDQRYMRAGTTIDTSIRVLSGPTRIEIFAAGAWRQVWPPLWS
jgi:hypothetical protein